MGHSLSWHLEQSVSLQPQIAGEPLCSGQALLPTDAGHCFRSGCCSTCWDEFSPQSSMIYSFPHTASSLPSLKDSPFFRVRLNFFLNFFRSWVLSLNRSTYKDVPGPSVPVCQGLPVWVCVTHVRSVQTHLCRLCLATLSLGLEHWSSILSTRVLCHWLHPSIPGLMEAHHAFNIYIYICIFIFVYNIFVYLKNLFLDNTCSTCFLNAVLK